MRTQNMILFGAVALILGMSFGQAQQSDSGEVQPYVKKKPASVGVLLYDWVDASREHRTVPVKIYYLKNSLGQVPVIVFSHGLGGNREGYAYLGQGQYWAQNGYVSVHVQHQGSDDAVWKDVPRNQRLKAMRSAARNAEVAIQRPHDIRFAIDQILKMNKSDGPLKGKIDPDKIGMAGHSFGAWTTMAVIGQVFTTPKGKDVSVPDGRIKAAIAMSTPKAKNDVKTAYAGIGIPLFHMTGTEDNTIVTNATPADKRVAKLNRSGFLKSRRFPLGRYKAISSIQYVQIERTGERELG